ncbi:hypothetical protein COL26_33220 [Bacillus thuringiensis]|uniref:Polysaccharide chain length determinant N-terminal domain-containing protein n=1 Tax=Bacillus thuringiensis TaxID=1428 RepID=A0ABD6SH02_BACTU|nr:Wzz/FepE/Etk N-terminal domain-containing protein [Bacillus thuringiensis]PER50998.1 hypothetical protein CN495_20265 [Bacillus thuringiensis]PEU86377.1 hypothetical protein CN411_18390 [Bacillus thuringiensis]PFI13470.1 hypothetical protein COI79_01035 [Bacillus thuringiensis]PFW19013.1 hypothetical protein COL26_33220 [Bacillus thuringiensis]PGY84765.1 hypothetical protein COE44_00730 [Bacillus thuringiensis]
MKNITLNDFWKLSKKYFWLIIILPIIVVTIVYAINKIILPPKYEATTQLLILSKKAGADAQSFDDVRSSMQLVETFSSIVQSEKTMNDVASELHLKRISDKVSVITNEKSLIINVKVTGKDKQQIVKVANAVAVEAQKKFQGLFEGMKVNILEKTHKSKEVSIKYQLILGAIAGFMSSFIMIYSLLFFNSIITKEEQVKQMGYIVLGDIPQMNNKEESQYVKEE